MNSEPIKSIDDIYVMLDSLFSNPTEYWNSIYQDRPEYMSFLTEYPDENLVQYVHKNMISAKKVLEFGCGEGRNAIFLAQQGFHVDAVDISDTAIKYALKNAEKHNIKINFQCKNVLDFDIENNTYDFVYDSGLLHHLLPHCRIQYLDLVYEALKRGSCFGLICFATGFEDIGGASEVSDYEVYKNRRILGGFAYSREKLIEIMSDRFELMDIRYMTEYPEGQLFGKSFLWASLWKKN
ncbi:class I SAM-dependent methyltransferase [Paenibacillus sp. GP183]|uniref:class I SAM-dependent methyltransferase n=1 Tax=Paenibacillus sp. GP183 TaxID=1882751 RepID=UPI000896924F|nr:class I SAM-dependent methyltransferase [Paenibacillus sp. GP183]SEC02927.1 Methyltransferase domain-containing protein [Paenibacillus sp. GP183]